MANNYRIHTYKSPILAGLLSFFIPGLGQFYNDERGKAILILTAFFLSLFIAITGWNPLMTFRMFHNYHFSEVYTMGLGFRSFSDPTIVNLYRMLFLLVVIPILYIFQLFDAIFSAQRINNIITAEAHGVRTGFTASETATSPAVIMISQDADQERLRREANQTMGSSVSGGKTGPSGTPPSGSPSHDPTPGNGSRNRLAWGIVFAFIGFVFLLSDILPRFDPFNLWPLIPLGFGLKLLWDHFKSKDQGQLIFGVILTAVGFIFMAEIWSPIGPFDVMGNMIDMAINRWYLALLFIGLLLIVQEMVRRNGKQNQ